MDQKPKDAKAEVDLPLSNGIDQIRDIILGEEIQSWEKRFDRIEKNLASLTKSTEKNLAELSERVESHISVAGKNNESLQNDLSATSQEIRSIIEKFKADLEKKIKTLADDKVDKDSIGDVFIQWGQKVKAK